MKFISHKAVNKLVPFSFHKSLQTNMPDYVLTNSAFSSIYLAPNRIPKNAKAQKQLFKKYDRVDDNLKEYRKDNFIEIDNEIYLVIGTVVKRSILLAYSKDKTKKEITFEMANPGTVLIQLIEDGKNILTPDLSEYELDRLGELSFYDDQVRVFVNIQNTETFEMDLIEVK